MKIFEFSNSYLSWPKILFQEINPVPVLNPKSLIFNRDLAQIMGLSFAVSEENLAPYWSGNLMPEGANPVALAYSGHQFGNFSFQLGDGRAVLLGTHKNSLNQTWDIQLKGSGPTPFSRGGDGRSPLAPALKEYLMSEALYALGVPTTRCLAVISTGEIVHRENPLPGGISVRVATHHIRIGTFEYLAARGDVSALKLLLDHTILRQDPQLIDNFGLNDSLVYKQFLINIAKRQIQLISQWMALGFIHGVMNTDNILLSGEAIDFGPSAFLNEYNPERKFSSIDINGRYRYSQQPDIIFWNLYRLAECMIPFFDMDEKKSVKIAEEVLAELPALYEIKWLEVFSRKLGFLEAHFCSKKLIHDFLQIMQNEQLDFTQTFNSLLYLHNPSLLKNHFFENLNKTLQWTHNQKSKKWIEEWKNELKKSTFSETQIQNQLEQSNPFIIPRNHWVETTIKELTENQNEVPFEKLIEALKNPFQNNNLTIPYFEIPENSDPNFKTFCGT